MPFFLELLWLAYFSLVTVIDLEHRLILHPVSLAGVILALPTGIWLHGLVPTLLGGAAGFVIMLGLYYLGSLLARLLARWRGDKIDNEALGFGDVNLSGVLGLLLGWPAILAGLVLTILIGGVGALAVMVVARVQGKYRPDLAIPYGPFLVISAAALLFFRQFLQ
jgi:leader peptidase (prepilin peptidase)/N-methyltransferase